MEGVNDFTVEWKNNSFIISGVGWGKKPPFREYAYCVRIIADIFLILKLISLEILANVLLMLKIMMVL